MSNLSAMSHPAKVLIVGAGPVGLSAAVALSRAGIPIRIVDRLPAPINQSRAAIIHARTLEDFQRLGIVDDFLATGVKVHGVVLYGSDNQILVRPSLDHIPSPYPYMLGLEQFKTEEILTARLEDAGVKVERGVELAEFKENGGRVSTVLRRSDGTEDRGEFDYLLGADGSHSAVRAGLGLHLEGTTIDQTWITADVKIRWDRDPGEAVACMSEEGMVFIAAMNDGRWRVIVSHKQMTPEEAAKATVADVEKIMSERFGMSMPLYDPVWISPFGLNTRMAPTMQVSRVFLAGDAAHVHSPIGGQGMNTGIQDSLNLAWKLTLVLKGLAKPELLESYNSERHANAKKLLEKIGAATKMASLRHPVAIEVRNHIIHLAGHLGIQNVMPGVVSMLNVGYPDSPVVSESHTSWLSRGPRAGERAPNAAGLAAAGCSEPTNLFELWSKDERHQALVFGDDIQIPASPLYKITRITKSGTPSDGVVVDTEGHAHEVYAAEKTRALYLVRPDGIIAFRDGDASPAALAGYLAKWYVV